MKLINVKFNTFILAFVLVFIFPQPVQAVVGPTPITISVSMTSTIPQDVEAEIQITNLTPNKTYYLHYNLFELIESEGGLIHDQSLSSSELYGPYAIDTPPENVTPTIQWTSTQLTSDAAGYRLYVFIHNESNLQTIVYFLFFNA